MRSVRRQAIHHRGPPPCGTVAATAAAAAATGGDLHLSHLRPTWRRAMFRRPPFLAHARHPHDKRRAWRLMFGLGRRRPRHGQRRQRRVPGSRINAGRLRRTQQRPRLLQTLGLWATTSAVHWHDRHPIRGVRRQPFQHCTQLGAAAVGRIADQLRLLLRRAEIHLRLLHRAWVLPSRHCCRLPLAAQHEGRQRRVQVSSRRRRPGHDHGAQPRAVRYRSGRGAWEGGCSERRGLSRPGGPGTRARAIVQADAELVVCVRNQRPHDPLRGWRHRVGL
mmetsp:Transcript_10050/g.31691  ORF Transcript_10050/g.31691 Transcript_10050/m.31691 type:complete len:277 (+) Transcript_10050:746-1576(+)